MDRGNKKRGRESPDPSSTSKRGKKRAEIEIAPAAADPIADEESGGQQRPLSIFEFPWNLATMSEGDHGCDLRDVFFSSLVDGCKAAIGFPGDRLSPSPAPISLPEEADGVDCIWSCALSQPLSLRCVR